MRVKESWRGPATVAVVVAFIAVAERLWPLRTRREPLFRRAARNALIAASGALASVLFERPLASRMMRLVERRHWGLRRFGLPAGLETALGVLLLDYTLYAWHVLTHRVPWLWRFHRVHHADRDLDATTAVRFHFGEMALSAPFRALQVAAIGVSPGAFRLWQQLLLISIAFHHANVRLPPRIERRLCRWVMTPRLHGRHHDPRHDVRSCNWSSGLALWDRIHGTFRMEERGDGAVGVEEASRPHDVTIAKLFVMPFQRKFR